MKNGHTDSIYNLILPSMLRYRNQIKVYLHKKRPPTGSLFLKIVDKFTEKFFYFYEIYNID